MTLFSFFYNLGAVMQVPMIMLETNNNIGLLALLGAGAGIGGLFGAAIMSIWGGLSRRIDSWLLGIVIVGLSRLLFSLGQRVLIWLPCNLLISMTLPIAWGSSQAIVMAKVEPDIQGRVFGIQQVVMLFASMLASLIAGPIADHGIQSGNPFATMYSISAVGIIVVGLTGFAVHNLRHIETLLPNYDPGRAAG